MLLKFIGVPPLPSADKIENLSEVPPPFLPPLIGTKRYTLVLDLDETLIHFFDGNSDEECYFLVRPGAIDFLQKMSEYYELVIFTAAIQEVSFNLISISMQIGLLTLSIQND